MKPDRFNRIKKLLREAADLPEAERQAFLSDADIVGTVPFALSPPVDDPRTPRKLHGDARWANLGFLGRLSGHGAYEPGWSAVARVCRGQAFARWTRSLGVAMPVQTKISGWQAPSPQATSR